MIEYIIILAIGIIIIILALSLSRKKTSIKKTGIVTEGIVYDLLHDQSTSSNTIYPIIRFLTTQQEWITETANIGMFPGFYKKGQKITVVYDPKNPKQFIINSKINSLFPYVILVLGCLLVLFGTYKLII